MASGRQETSIAFNLVDEFINNNEGNANDDDCAVTKNQLQLLKMTGAHASCCIVSIIDDKGNVLHESDLVKCELIDDGVGDDAE